MTLIKRAAPHAGEPRITVVQPLDVFSNPWALFV